MQCCSRYYVVIEIQLLAVLPNKPCYSVAIFTAHACVHSIQFTVRYWPWLQVHAMSARGRVGHGPPKILVEWAAMHLA